MRRGGYFRRKTPIKLSNRYTPLQNENTQEEEEDDVEIIDEAQETATQQTPRRQAPAPIVIPREGQNHKDITQMLTNTTNGGFYVNYTRNNINLYLDNKDHKKQILENLKQKKIEHHTYTDYDDKTHAFVLRGLDSQPTTDEVHSVLSEQYKLPIKKVYTMRTKYRPLYLVVTSAAVALKELQTKVKHILYTRISWERHENKKILTQCQRCQNYGHATSNCSRNPRCVKCDQSHLTRDCTKSKDADAKCCNCSGKHPANYRNCPHYLEKLEVIAKKNPRVLQKLTGEPTKKDEYIPAPAPASNPWTPGEATTSRGADFPPLPPPAPARRQLQRTRNTNNQTTRQQDELRLPPSSSYGPRDTQVPKQAPSAPQINDSVVNPNNYTIFSDLSAEISELNSLINLENLLHFVKDLNINLRQCTPENRALAAVRFLQNIHNYNI